MNKPNPRHALADALDAVLPKGTMPFTMDCVLTGKIGVADDIIARLRADGYEIVQMGSEPS